jgi:two-component system response regulator CpxR
LRHLQKPPGSFTLRARGTPGRVRTLKIEGHGRKILVIDDDLAIRVLLQAVLTRMDFVVDLAEDGEIGLQRLAERQYDLVLLDLMMPRVNGYEFLQRVRKSAAPQPHVIVFTAAGQRGVDKLPAESVCASILKPFDLESFIDMITDCVEERHDVQPAAEKTS